MREVVKILNYRKYIISQIADIHLNPKNALDIYQELQNNYLNILRKLPKLDLVVICGDLLDYKASFNSIVSRIVLKLISELAVICEEKNASLRIIQGTRYHDDSHQLDNFNFIEILKPIDFKIIKNISREIIKGDLEILYLPEEYPDDNDYYTEYLDRQYDLIFGHGMFREVAFDDNSEITMKKAPIYDSKLIESHCKGYAVFGHIHAHQIIRNHIYYTGSFRCLSFGEEEDKGWLLSMYAKVNDKSAYGIQFIKNCDSPIYRDVILTKEMLESYDPDNLLKYVEEYKTMNNIDKLRVICLNDHSDVVTVNIRILMDYYKNNKEIIILIKNTDLIKKKEEDKIKHNEIKSQYGYLFDKGLTREEKIQRYIQDEQGVQIEIDVLNDILYTD